MMKTMFCFNGPWKVVDKGFSEEETEPKLIENRQKDACSCFISYSTSSASSLLSQITVANTAKEAWDILKTQFQGSPKIMALRIQH